MIDEMICAFDSPGSVSADLMIALLFRNPTMYEGQTPATNNGNMPRWFTLSGAPNWLAAESVLATNACPRCEMTVHAQCQCRKTN